MRRSRWALLGAAGVLCAVVVAGCTGSSPEGLPPEPEMSDETTQSPINLEDLPADVSPEGVIVAALLLQSGDIARAVEEGLVSPAEVEYAREAIQEGTLQLWVDAAVVK